MLPAVILITSFVLFYIKKVSLNQIHHKISQECSHEKYHHSPVPQYSLIYNLEPDRRGATKTARNNFLYLLLMLATLGFFLFLVGVALSR